MSLSQEVLYNVVRSMPADAEGVEQGIFLLCLIFALLWIYGKKRPVYHIEIPSNRHYHDKYPPDMF